MGFSHSWVILTEADQQSWFDHLSDTARTLLVAGIILAMSMVSVAISMWIRHRRKGRNGDII